MKFKYFVPILIFLSALSLLKSHVYAYDATVTCLWDCSISNTSPMFPAGTIWYPGLSDTRSVHIINNLDQTRTVGTGPSSSVTNGAIDAVMNLVIANVTSGGTVWTGTLKEFYGLTDQITLPAIPPNDNLDLTYTVSMDEKAGNEYQDKKTSFDLNFYYEVIKPTPTSTPVPNNSNNSSSSTGTGGGGGGGGTSNSPSTGNVIATVQPVISFFRNLPPISDLITAPPEVAGEQVEVPGETKGASVCRDCVWWPFALLEIVGLMFIYRLFRKTVPKPHIWIGGLVALASYLAFLFSNSSCIAGIFVNSPNLLCRLFLLPVIVIYAITTLIARRMNTKQI